MDTYDLIDNLSVYRHLQFPREIIKNPKVIIKVKNKLTNAIYFFGCATMPLKKELEETKDKYLRTAAELENTRRRSSIDIESAVRNRAISIASKFLPVMDAIEAALKHTPDDEGVKSMAKVMETTFAQLGITKIEAVGQKLNPQLHNAIQVIETKKESDETIAPNTIVEEMQTGYMFGDTVIRTAMVVVSK